MIVFTDDDVVPAAGDLAIARDEDDVRYLRRVWPVGGEWVLQSTNPVRPIPCVRMSNETCRLRKVVGVLYECPSSEVSDSDSAQNEWQPRCDFSTSWVTDLHAIGVIGHSLDPIARAGQRILVGEARPSSDSGLRNSDLAVLETATYGHVIKRVFRHADRFLLLSPNPVEVHDPDIVSLEDISRIWPVRGVLMESDELEEEA